MVLVKYIRLIVYDVRKKMGIRENKINKIRAVFVWINYNNLFWIEEYEWVNFIYWGGEKW